MNIRFGRISYHFIYQNSTSNSVIYLEFAEMILTSIGNIIFYLEACHSIKVKDTYNIVHQRSELSITIISLLP